MDKDWERCFFFKRLNLKRRLQGIQRDREMRPNQKNEIKLQKLTLKKHKSLNLLTKNFLSYLKDAQGAKREHR